MTQSQPPSDIAYFQSVESLITTFQTDINSGLKTSEIEKRQLEYGYNELPKIRKSLWKIYLAPIFNFLIIDIFKKLVNMKIFLYHVNHILTL